MTGTRNCERFGRPTLKLRALRLLRGGVRDGHEAATLRATAFVWACWYDASRGTASQTRDAMPRRRNAHAFVYAVAHRTIAALSSVKSSASLCSWRALARSRARRGTRRGAPTRAAQATCSSTRIVLKPLYAGG
eukprot:IDg2272t1